MMPRLVNAASTRFDCNPRRPVCAGLSLFTIGLGWMQAALAAATLTAGGFDQFPQFKATEARIYLDTVAHSVESQFGTDANCYLLLARLRNQLGEKDQAERLARLALASDPTRADIDDFLSRILILQDRMEEAAVLLKRALQLKPDLPGGQRQLGMTLDRLGDREGARHAFEAAVLSAPRDATAQFLFGRVLLDRGQLEAAAEHLKTAWQLDSALTGALYLLSQVQQELGDLKAARQSLYTFQRLKDSEKKQLDARNAAYDDERFMRALAAGFHAEVASYCLMRQQAQPAQAHLRQAVIVDPDEPAGHERLILFFLQRGQLVDARAPGEVLVRLRPKQPLYRVNLGNLLLQLKDDDGAERELQTALDLDPNQLEALDILARLRLSQRRNLGEALILSRRLVDRNANASNLDLLGWAFYANGQTNEARAAAARAVALDPTNSIYRERFRRLQNAP